MFPKGIVVESETCLNKIDRCLQHSKKSVAEKGSHAEDSDSFQPDVTPEGVRDVTVNKSSPTPSPREGMDTDRAQFGASSGVSLWLVSACAACYS